MNIMFKRLYVHIFQTIIAFFIYHTSDYSMPRVCVGMSMAIVNAMVYVTSGTKTNNNSYDDE